MTAVPPPGTYLPDAWFIAARSGDLGRKPLAVTQQGRPLVLFRTRNGTATALSDRCPHRNVPLSLGRVRDGELECAYHGWRFDGAGQCTAVPGLLDGARVSLKSRCVEAWATREAQGYVWVYSTPSVTPSTEPFRFPHLDEAGYTTVRRDYVVDAPLHAAVENVLDVPHTAYLHGGLFRTAAKRNVVDVLVRRHDTWAEAQFHGEPRPAGLIGRLLAPGGGVVEHTDRFFLPSIAQVEYRLGPVSHLVATSAMTPESDTRTRIFAVVTFRLPLPGWLVKPVLVPIASRILAQDAWMLARQTDTVKRFGGEKFTSTELDVLGPQVARLLEQAAAKAPPGPPHEHRVQMKT
jgi:phenylpropionate dioxygenase-like ring-hydroxylating dioxygenase large terminal subunit